MFITGMQILSVFSYFRRLNFSDHKNLKRVFTILSALFILAQANGQQDPQLTQFYSCPLYLAPSFAGATQQHRVATTYRNQWPGLPAALYLEFARKSFQRQFQYRIANYSGFVVNTAAPEPGS